jgi:hypothetical protein
MKRWAVVWAVVWAAVVWAAADFDETDTGQWCGQWMVWADFDETDTGRWCGQSVSPLLCKTDSFGCLLRLPPYLVWA